MNVVDAGGSGTARNAAPASSARRWSKSLMKSPPANMHSAIDNTSSPADTP
jgi:hypothetical protein